MKQPSLSDNAGCCFLCIFNFASCFAQHESLNHACKFKPSSVEACWREYEPVPRAGEETAVLAAAQSHLTGHEHPLRVSRVQCLPCFAEPWCCSHA